jgi:hypothetical protein
MILDFLTGGMSKNMEGKEVEIYKGMDSHGGNVQD